eukprot:6609042-Ditylum_brightwellii.AAC.1
MKQYQAVSASKPFEAKEMSDIKDLLKVNKEIDNAKAACEMENFVLQLRLINLWMVLRRTRKM